MNRLNQEVDDAADAEEKVKMKRPENEWRSEQSIKRQYTPFDGDTKKERNKEAASKYRKRKKLEKAGLELPESVKKGKKGVKIQTDGLDDETKVRRDEFRKWNKNKMVSIVIHPEKHHMPLRQRKGLKNNPNTLQSRLEAIADLLSSKDYRCTLKELNKIAENALQAMKANCYWSKSFDGETIRLFVLEEVGDASSKHIPWINVKASPTISTKSDLNLGVFAARDFEEHDILGVYAGNFMVNDGKDSRQFAIGCRPATEEEGEIIYDIPEYGDGRLGYGMGMHLINDYHFPNGASDVDYNMNNAELRADFSIVAKKNIRKGDEIFMSYNLKKIELG